MSSGRTALRVAIDLTPLQRVLAMGNQPFRGAPF
jgi:hypothetical protein